MAKGKNTCKILKEIRKQIAEDNDIELIVEECTYKGDCTGTCPKCEAEVRYLERELEKRQRLGKAAIIAGVSLGTIFAATSCSSTAQSTSGPNSNSPCSTDSRSPDTIPERPLAGDVVMVVPEKPKADPDTVITEPLMGLVPMFYASFQFNNDQYQSLLKEHFVYPEMENLSVVSGEIIYEHVGTDGDICKSLEDLVGIAKEFISPYCAGGETKMLEHIASELADKGIAADKYSGDMEVKFFVDPAGKLSNVKITKGINGKLDEAVAAIFEEMVWYPAMYEMKDGSFSSSFECYCVQKIHFPVK